MVKPLVHYFMNDKKLDSKIRLLTYNYNDAHFNFHSDLGVFSKNKIDYGSRLLVEAFLSFNKENKKSVLDVGSGFGFLGITISKILDCPVDMIDVNERAIHLTKMNIKENQVEGNAFISDMYESVNSKYDVIITNPPIKAGKKVYLNILLDAKEYLNECGELWFVIRVNHGAKSVIKCLENVYFCEIMNKSKGFLIIKAKIR